MSRKKSKKLQREDSTDGTTKLLCDEALNHLKAHNYAKALILYNQALELNPSDQNALVARSKCYLLLGEPQKALQDAEAALNVDKNNIRAIYQKAEALYFLGQFEHSLMFFHRGLRLRPELNTFRLGVQKTQEAIENTIGIVQPKSKRKIQQKGNQKSKQSSSPPSTAASNVTTARKPRTARSNADFEKKTCRRLLGELCVDKEYLENLINHPELKSEQISTLAKEGVTFLNTRQEFWKQQMSCTGLVNQKIHTINPKDNSSNMPKWF